MYESKYSKYITKSKTRFAEPEEIKGCCEPIGKKLKSNACGVPLYYEDGLLYVDNSDVHYMIKGSTGCKKTRVQVFNIVNSIIKANENAVINDPKGEIYRKTASYAKERGYKVLTLNLRDMTKSNGWNPLSLPYKLNMDNNIPESEQALDDLTEAIIGPALKNTVDRYWADSSGLVFYSSSKLLMDSVPKNHFNISNVIQLTHESNADTLRKILKSMDQTTNVATSMHGYLDLVAEKTSSCIYSTMKACLKPFIQNQFLLELLCRDEIDFKDLTDPKEKTIIYIIYPDEKTSLCFLVNLFLTQCYQVLITDSSKFIDGRLPKRVNFVLDEFSNLPAVENFDNRISEARGHNIRYILITQSFSQLKNKYKEHADTITANCEWVVFPSKELDLLEKVSKMCGTVFDYRGCEKRLIDVSDIQHMKKYPDGAEVLIIKNGQYPFVAKIPDYEYIDIFDKYPDACFDEITSTDSPVYISFEDWVEGIGETYNFPFPKEGRTVDLRINEKPKKKSEPITDEELQKELERKFEELFGDLDED